MSDRTRIDWCDATINPWGWGCYGPGGTPAHPLVCSYCYAQRIAKRNLRTCPKCREFVPHWHGEELHKPVFWRKAKRIFVESMGDPFGSWVRPDEISMLFVMMAAQFRHTFFLLTKQPSNIREMLKAAEVPVLDNVWLGTTVDDESRAVRAEKYMGYLDQIGWRTFVSIEPMLEAVPTMWLTPYRWIIMGAMTGPHAAGYVTDRDWVLDVEDYGAWHHVPVFVKSSLAHISTRQEWPQ